MQEPGLYTIHIQELTTTIPDTITNIRDIPVSIISIDIDVGTMDFMMNQVNSTAALTLRAHGCPIIGMGIFTIGEKVRTKGDIKDYGIRTVVVGTDEAEENKQR